jgi:hypothetical protein
MAKDVAQRELDQAGFRIGNLGDPKVAGDATKTDNTAVPRPSVGLGAPGNSLLAAPADHVHPASGEGGILAITTGDATYQAVTGTEEEVVGEFFADITGFVGEEIEVEFTALVKASAGVATFNVRLGGTPGLPDGTLVATISTNSTEFVGQDSPVTRVPNPAQPLIVKITAKADAADHVAHIRGKVVDLRSA